MPLSSCRKLSLVMDLVYELQPVRVLDIGCGWGTYGWLCRQYLDPDVPGENSGRANKPTIIGVEVFEKYRNPMWKLAYDDVHIGDARDVVPKLGHFDLVLLCDVIEHLPKEVGLRMLDDLLGQSSYAVVSSPIGYSEQGALYGNESERHVSSWAKDDFKKYHYVYRECYGGFVVLLSKNPMAHALGAKTHPWLVAKQSIRNLLPAPLVDVVRALLWPFRRIGRALRKDKQTREAE